MENAVKNADGSVSVPGEWLVRLAEYKIRIEEAEKTYNELMAIYGGNRE